MKKPLYRFVYSELKESILNSSLPVGTQLPTDKELTEKYDVSTITIKKAMDLLKDDQLISRSPGKGSYVIQNKVTHQKNAIIESDLPIIGLIITDFNEFFGMDTLKSITKYSIKKAQIIFKLSGGDPELEEEMIDEMITIGVDGLMILPSSSEYLSPRLLELVSKKFPVVLIDRFIEKLPTCNVQINNQLAAERLVEHLFDYGHKHIGVITANRDITTNEERIKGAISAHLAHHVPLKQSQILTNLQPIDPKLQHSTEKDIDKIKNFLISEENLTAIFAGDYAIALLVKQAVEEMGKEVTKDFSVVCFDHPRMDRLDKHAYVFTHIKQNEEALGKNSVDLILEKIENPKLIKKLNSPFHLVHGMSVKKIN